MNQTVTYVFDPLCGWCYGARRAVARLARTPGVTLELAPSGLFSESGARSMDDAFAAYAWSNDQRIASLTGERFTDAYRTKVLADRVQLLDSGPATIALSAVSLTDPDRELEALEAIQDARYVEGRNVTDRVTLAGLLRALGLDRAAAMMERSDADLRRAARVRTRRTGDSMRALGAQKVPAVIVTKGTERRMLPPSALYGEFDTLAARLDAA